MPWLSSPCLRSCLLALSLISAPALAAPGAEERQGIVQAQSDIRSSHGGHKLSQNWQGDKLLLVWQDRAGARLLIRVDPSSGRWQVLRREDPRR